VTSTEAERKAWLSEVSSIITERHPKDHITRRWS
jgi:hypothetical protein